MSDWNDPVFDALARHAVSGIEGAVAVPVISSGFTDSLFLRPRGVKAYGLVPFVLTQDELSTMHGDKESVSVADMKRAVHVMVGFVAEVAAAP